MAASDLRQWIIKAVEDGNSEYWEKSRAVEEQWRNSQPGAPVDGPGTIINCIAEKVLAALDQQAEEREALERVVRAAVRWNEACVRLHQCSVTGDIDPRKASFEMMRAEIDALPSELAARLAVDAGAESGR